MPYDKWLEQVRLLDPASFDYYTEWYSFFTAWEEGKTPKEAYDDCNEWLTG